VDLSGVCEGINVRVAERVVGSRLPGHRAAITTDGEVSCVFGGTDARFVVRSTTDPKEAANILGRVDRTGVPGIPVEVDTYPEGVGFVIDNRVFRIELKRATGALVEETDLPKLVVDAFKACGDDLAGC
jgi:hypothetical protein